MSVDSANCNSLKRGIFGCFGKAEKTRLYSAAPLALGGHARWTLECSRECFRPALGRVASTALLRALLSARTEGPGAVETRRMQRAPAGRLGRSGHILINAAVVEAVHYAVRADFA